MLNRSASLAMSTCVLKALPGKLDINRHSSSILYFSDLSHHLCPYHKCADSDLMAMGETSYVIRTKQDSPRICEKIKNIKKLT